MCTSTLCVMQTVIIFQLSTYSFSHPKLTQKTKRSFSFLKFSINPSVGPLSQCGNVCCTSSAAASLLKHSQASRSAALDASHQEITFQVQHILRRVTLPSPLSISDTFLSPVFCSQTSTSFMRQELADSFLFPYHSSSVLHASLISQIHNSGRTTRAQNR